MKKILVVEDEKTIRDAIIAYLANEKYRVFIAEDGEVALTKFKEINPDLIVLDLMMPNLSGEDVCREIRKSSRIPILMLTAKSLESDKVFGFDIGADDYLTKPFSLKELMSRINAILRRADNNSLSNQISYNNDDLNIDFITATVKKQQNIVKLTKNEFGILKLLSTHPLQIFARDQIINSIYDDFDGFDRAIDSHIKNLRAKIESNPSKPKYIVTVHGMGYKFKGE